MIVKQLKRDIIGKKKKGRPREKSNKSNQQNFDGGKKRFTIPKIFLENYLQKFCEWMDSLQICLEK